MKNRPGFMRNAMSTIRSYGPYPSDAELRQLAGFLRHWATLIDKELEHKQKAGK